MDTRYVQPSTIGLDTRQSHVKATQLQLGDQMGYIHFKLPSTDGGTLRLEELNCAATRLARTVTSQNVVECIVMIAMEKDVDVCIPAVAKNGAR